MPIKAKQERKMPVRASGMRVRLEAPSMRHAAAFIAAVQQSRSLHGRWTRLPSTTEQFRAFVRRMRRPTHRGHLVYTEQGSLAGVININEIVRGAFCSGYLGYSAFVPHHGSGYTRAGLIQVIQLAFRRYGLHRLEANIQPDNVRSIRLARSLGFRREGYSPRYLKIAGRWRDHERWAVTVEDWKARRAAERADWSRAGSAALRNAAVRLLR